MPGHTYYHFYATISIFIGVGVLPPTISIFMRLVIPGHEICHQKASYVFWRFLAISGGIISGQDAGPVVASALISNALVSPVGCLRLLTMLGDPDFWSVFWWLSPEQSPHTSNRLRHFSLPVWPGGPSLVCSLMRLFFLTGVLK